MSDNFVDLGHGEVAELTPSFWSDSQRLFRAGEKLKAMAAKPADPRVEMMARDYAPPKPQTPGLEAQFYRRVDDAPFDAEEAARQRRTAEAHYEIMRAMDDERKAAEQRQEQVRQEMRAAFYASPMGNLLRGRR
jgi:hypothetical protein